MSNSRTSLRVLTALSLVTLTGCGTLVSATRERDAAAVQKMLAEGKDPNAEDDGMTPLCVAVEQKDDAIATMLIKAGASKETTCSNGSPLCGASLELMKTFLDAGFSANGTCDGTSLLASAALEGRLTQVQLLLEAGVDPFARSKDGTVVEHLLWWNADEKAMEQRGKTLGYVLALIAKKHGKETVTKLINTKSPKNGMTPVLLAVGGNLNATEALLRYGPDLDVTAPMFMVDDDEVPAIFFALAGSDKAKVRTIVKLLTDRGLRTDVRSKRGRTFEEVKKIQADGIARFQEESERSNREWEARAAKERAEVEREERARNQAQGAAWMGALAGQGTMGKSSGPSTNPVDDNSFRDRMMKQAQGATPSTSTPSTPAAPSTSAPATNKADTNKADANKEDAAKKAEEARREKEAKDAKEKAEREAAQKEREAAAQRDRAEFLSTMRSGITLAASKCGGDGNYHVIGRKPRAKLDLCINVTYRATCGGGRDPSTGVLRNFTGGGSCFGDTQVISPKPSCKVEEVTVMVDDVQLCTP